MPVRTIAAGILLAWLIIAALSLALWLVMILIGMAIAGSL